MTPTTALPSNDNSKVQRHTGDCHGCRGTVELKVVTQNKFRISDTSGSDGQKPKERSNKRRGAGSDERGAESGEWRAARSPNTRTHMAVTMRETCTCTAAQRWCVAGTKRC
eukprot:gene12160-biopygen7919